MVETLTPTEQAAFAKSFFASFPASARDQLLAEAVRAEIAQVEAILEAHGAFNMHYYGNWDLVDLSSNQPTP